MKRVFAVLGAVFALMLFSTSFAFAQPYAVYRKATVDELNATGKVLALASTDSVVIDYETDPMNIPGIQVISEDTTRPVGNPDTTIFAFSDEVNGPFLIEKGQHFVSCENPEARIRGLWLLAPGAQLWTDLSAGGEGDLTQILGNGPENDAITVFWAYNVEVFNTVIAGSGGIMLSAGTAHFEKTYITNSGNDADSYFIREGIIWKIPNYPTAGIRGWLPNNFSMKNVLCWNNTSWDMLFQAYDKLFNFSATNCSFLSYNDDGLNREYAVEIRYDNGLSRVEFMDCRFAEFMEKEITGEYGFAQWFGKHMNDGSMFFRETRPGGVAGTSIVQLWPRETPLIPTDFTGNGEVGLSDILYLATDFGAQVDEVQFGYLYDLDKSLVVDMPDLAVVTRGYLGIPEDVTLSEVAGNPEMVASLEQKGIALLEALEEYPEAKDALMNDPGFGILMRAFIQTAVAEVGGEVPSEFALSQNYPNPFNSSTQIRFSVAEPGFVELKVYDMLGRAVYTLVSEHLEPGVWTQNWDGLGVDGRPVASGTYFYRMSAGEYTQTNKMLLLR